MRLYSVGLLLLWLALLPTPGVGQEPSGPPPPTSEELPTYVQAYLAVVVVQEEWQPRLARIHDVQARAEAQLVMNREVEEALAAHGMTRRRYAQISFLVSGDPSVREAFLKLLEEARAPS